MSNNNNNLAGKPMAKSQPPAAMRPQTAGDFYGGMSPTQQRRDSTATLEDEGIRGAQPGGNRRMSQAGIINSTA
jgi:hypothetical protein